MKTLSSMKSRERGNTFMQVINADSGLKPCSPAPTKGETIIRIIPEVAADGSLRPMFAGKTAAGDEWSSLKIENTSINVGVESKFTVLNQPSDKPALDQMNCPFSGAFIKLRHKQKTKSYSKELADRTEALFQGTVRPGQKFASGQAMTQARDQVFVQCLVLKLNGETLAKPAMKQVAILSGTTGESLDLMFKKAYKEGIDLFNPKGGRAIVLKPMQQRGNDIMIYDAEMGAPIPLSEDTCRKLWVPWDQVLIRYTYDELMVKLIQSIGSDLAGSVFPEDVRRLTAAQSSPQRTTVVAAATAPAATVAAQTTIAPVVADSGVPELAIDADGEAPDLESGDGAATTVGGGAPAVAQTSTELEAMYAKMLADDPTLQ